MTRAAFPESAAAILRPAIHATAAAARQRAISAALYLSAIQGAQRTALRAPRNIPRAKHRTSRNPETNVTDSGIQPRHEQSHPLREKSQTSASRTASAHLSAAVLALSAAVFLLATPAHAQSTNQLYMTGTGSGHAPTLYTNGVDSNISLAITPKGTGGVGIGNTAPGALLDLGLAGTTTGNLRLEGKTSGYVQISPSAAAGSWTMILPTGVSASNGYVLSSTAAGVTSWVANGGGGSTSLSSLTSATATSSINNTSFPQTWQWNSLTNGTALTISSSSMTTGSLLSLQDTAASATATGQVLSISDTTTGPGYAVYSAMTGHSNTGYAGYFSNTDTSTKGTRAKKLETVQLWQCRASTRVFTPAPPALRHRARLNPGQRSPEAPSPSARARRSNSSIIS